MTSLRQNVFALLVVASAVSGCGGGSGSAPAPVNSAPDHATRSTAAQQTAVQSAECQRVTPFYFEIGDGAAAITTASIGGATYTATTRMNIASASKWLFGAYVAQVRGGALNTADWRATRMQTGYVSMGALSCNATMTVQSCFESGPNDVLTSGAIDRFNYGGGHFQKWSVDNVLGPLDSAGLATAFQSQLGTDIALQFGPPQPAGGGIAAASDYAIFLRKILRGQLHIAPLLGTQKICTLPGVCASADNSPITEAWSYSIGHWVEDDPANGDGAFSSAGAFGFYPWIDSSKTYYGVLARAEAGAGAAWGSVECGRKLRKAFLTGVAQ